MAGGCTSHCSEKWRGPILHLPTTIMLGRRVGGIRGYGEAGCPWVVISLANVLRRKTGGGE